MKWRGVLKKFLLGLPILPSQPLPSDSRSSRLSLTVRTMDSFVYTLPLI